MKYQYKGNFEKAKDELKKDCNNAVAQVYDSFNNKEGKLSQVIFTLKNNYAKKESISDASSNIWTKCSCRSWRWTTNIIISI